MFQIRDIRIPTNPAKDVIDQIELEMKKNHSKIFYLRYWTLGAVLLITLAPAEISDTDYSSLAITILGLTVFLTIFHKENEALAELKSQLSHILPLEAEATEDEYEAFIKVIEDWETKRKHHSIISFLTHVKRKIDKVIVNQEPNVDGLHR